MALRTYTATIEFPVGKQGVTISSNWGRNFKDTVDPEKDTIVTRGTSFFGQLFGDEDSYKERPRIGHGFTPDVILGATHPKHSLFDAQELMQYLEIAKSNLVSGANSEAQLAAIDCAEQRVSSYANHVRTRYMQHRDISLTGTMTH